LLQSLGSLLVVALCLGGTARRASASGVAEGVDLTGKPVDPLHGDRSKAVVLVFVRTDCPISNRYAPTIQRLSAEYAGKVTFWLVYPDRKESAIAIQKHLEEYGYKLPALRDPQHSLVKLAEAQVTPEVALFDGRQLVSRFRPRA
jgi:thiol-disulfide isomerase/thioredoxin